MLCAYAARRGHEVHGTFLSTPVAQEGVSQHRLDVRDLAAVRGLVGRLRPGVVVNTAYRQDDWATTAAGAAHLALACDEWSVSLVQVSSDVVFSGAASPYDEEASPDPVSDYGRAKLAAEQAVTEVLPAASIVRTSLVLGTSAGRRSPMEQLVHDLSCGEREGVLFTDDVRCPVHVDDLAEALLEVVERGSCLGPGVLHCAGADALSRYAIALLVAERDGLDASRFVTGSRADLGIPGPLDLRLDGRATQQRLATRLRGAREFLAPASSQEDLRP